MIIRKADAVPGRAMDMPGAEGVRMRLLIHEAEGAPHFFMRQFTVAPGGHTPMHEHEWEHEAYVLAGEGAVRGAGQARPISPGDCVFIPAGEQHQFANTGAEDLTFLCLVPRDSG